MRGIARAQGKAVAIFVVARAQRGLQGLGRRDVAGSLAGDDDIAASEFAGSELVAVARPSEAAGLRRCAKPVNQGGNFVDIELVTGEMCPVASGFIGLDSYSRVRARKRRVVEDRQKSGKRVYGGWRKAEPEGLGKRCVLALGFGLVGRIVGGDRSGVHGLAQSHGLQTPSPRARSLPWCSYSTSQYPSCGGVLAGLMIERSRPGEPLGLPRVTQAAGAISRAQSAKLGTKPRSSTTCRSPISRTGTSRPSLLVIVTPNSCSSII
jgi:hypothetical protein